jgi:hypothetical protein
VELQGSWLPGSQSGIRGGLQGNSHALQGRYRVGRLRFGYIAGLAAHLLGGHILEAGVVCLPGEPRTTASGKRPRPEGVTL